MTLPPNLPAILDGAENSNDAACRRLFRIYAHHRPLEARCYTNPDSWPAREAAIKWGRSQMDAAE
ncbi:hypothetical protein [Mameliella alba]|uniref:hypothetical protein n=1 Tax=Mameliella alba TaxID=561184 RepID=UPI000B531D82|nr:hypothetical protein [Mameliella alba]OWV44233.1 hypothetical protein CDZ95_05985 [Mameliella alba]